MSSPLEPRLEKSSKRIRVLFAGIYLIDTNNANLVWEKPNYPTYFFSVEDLPDSKYLQDPTGNERGVRVFDIVVGEKKAPMALTVYGAGADYNSLVGLFTINFGAMDAWFEEDEQIYVHPKDPYKRVDVLHSSRHVCVEVNGVEVANTRRPLLLFETSLPVRTYIPKVDCKLDLLVPSQLTTQCPYKGEASYYHVQLHGSGQVFENIVWWYKSPIVECAAIRGYCAFYDEQVDVWVDGIKQSRPA